MSSQIIRIADAASQDIQLAGGKGASLNRLMSIDGLNVPEGYIITTDAFKAFTRPVGQLITSILHSEQDNPAEASIKLKDVISGLEFPPDFETELKNALDTMETDSHGMLLAVRSSATAEDLPDTSFAGQHDTFLNVQGYDNIKSAIKSCFASLYNERAIAYRAKNRFDRKNVSMAVILQKMIPAEVSGVMFTADPMTSDRHTVVIEAVKGLGEALVSGQKTPMTWHIKNGEISKNGEIDAALSDAQIGELVQTGKKIEAATGQPQDIEWCFTGGKFHIVQSRVITTLYPCPPSKDGFKRCFLSIAHMQVMTDTMLPLGMSFWGLMSPNFHLVAAGGRLYLEVTHNLQSRSGMALLRQKMSNSDLLMDDALLKVWARKEYIRSIPKGKGSQFGIPGAIVPVLLTGWKAYRKNDPAMIESYERRMEEKITKVEKELSPLRGKAVMSYILRDTKDLMRDLMDPEGFGPLLISFYLTKSIDKEGKELLGRDAISSSVSKWLRVNIASEMGASVSRIADVARDFPKVVKYLETAGDHFRLEDLYQIPGGEAAAKEFEAFFAKFGMRCPGEIDITKPRFAEQPSKILSSILAEIKLPKGYAAKKFEQGKRESDEAVQMLISASKEKRGARKAKKLEKMLSFYRNFTGLRESPKYYWMKRYWVYKQAILREAEALAHAGKIRRADDVNYLNIDEISSLLGGSFSPDYVKIDNMRSEYERWAALTPPRLIFSDGEVVQGRYKRDVPEGALLGLAVSSGIVEGRARVISDIKDANRIEKGDILVTKYTDPSWTPTFMSIDALVTEIGGMATHGAVITREYGLPAVVGVENATTLIRDGQCVRVNGSDGYVELI